MKRSVKYRQQHAAARQKADAILAAADAAGRDLTAEETAAFDGHRAEMTRLEVAIQREVALEEAERFAPAADPSPSDRTPQVTGVRHRSEDDTRRRGFASHRDFLLAALEHSGHTRIEDVGDERLRPIAVATDRKDKAGGAGEVVFMLPQAFTPRGLLAAAGADEHGTYADPYGGFAVPTTLLPGLLSVGTEGDPSAGRTQPVPMQSPTVEILARVDKDHSTSVSGGLTVSRRAETGAFADSRGKLEKVRLHADTLAGLAYATEELLTDSPISFVAILDAGFRDQFAHHMIGEKLRGKGAGEFLGILSALAGSNNGPTISIAKETGQAADTILAQNVMKMRARCWGYGNAIWLANHDTYPILRAMVLPAGVGGQLMYQPSLVEGRPDLLEGRPIVYTEYASKLGDQGDLILANWSQYLEGLYQPLQSAESVHVRFINHERTFKFWVRNAGAPWWRTALTPNQSSDTLSPFVVLDAR